jgi:UDP-N-acetylmuramoylalanine--D-glutamate ligase
MIDVRDKHITIVGAARSGVGAAVMLAARGAKVFVTDAGEVAESTQKRLLEQGIPFEEQGHSERAHQAELVVISPGVPSDAPLIRHFLAHGVPVWSEVEWASQMLDGNLIAITGSNGKTTTTSWVDDMWKRAGIVHVTAGNIGSAISEHIAAGIPSWTDVILEVSSFQLDHIHQFKPKVSVLLNITPDHLNRYQYKFENYIAAKFRIFENQDPNDLFIYWEDDPVIRTHLPMAFRTNGPQQWTFSSENKVHRGAYVQDTMLMMNVLGKEEEVLPIDEIYLKGRHNLHNGMAAALAARASSISLEIIRESLRSFEGVEHRLELVRVLNGVRYVNDSKATNVNAVWYALESMSSPVVLILGGRDKGNDYSELNDLLRTKVHTIIAIGEGKEAVKTQLTSVVGQMVEAATMEDAVQKAFALAHRGDTVLLSPACASFDMFENFEHRGTVFKKAVQSL